MVRWLFFATAVALISLGSYLYFYLGAYKEATVSEATEPAFHIVYKTHRGPYHQINPVIEEVEKWALTQGVPCSVTFGEYLDDPAMVDPERLRSHGGCVVPEPVGELPQDFTQRKVPGQDYVVATFSGSPSIGPFKVYDKVDEYTKKNRILLEEHVFEIYKTENGRFTTRYLFPIKSK